MIRAIWNFRYPRNMTRTSIWILIYTFAVNWPRRTERIWKTLTTRRWRTVTYIPCSVSAASLNVVTITPAADLYQYRAYLETLLTYSRDAAALHLTNTFRYLDNGDMLHCDPSATYTDATNKGFIARWNRIKQNKEVEMVGRSHSDICNVPTHLLPGVRMQIKLTKARREFFLVNKDADSKVIFKFLATSVTSASS